ncbi:MAG: hypothetical protein K0R66_1528 [Gammaproteobacteria bacterium]|jgi:hypothetical protein|nr:hypothetical protein [Gammaproteobacteria bacterium]
MQANGLAVREATRILPVAVLIEHNIGSAAPIGSPTQSTGVIAALKRRAFQKTHELLEASVGSLHALDLKQSLQKIGIYPHFFSEAIINICKSQRMEALNDRVQVTAVVLDANLQMPSECPLLEDLDSNIRFLLSYFPNAKVMLYSGDAKTLVETDKPGAPVYRKLNETFQLVMSRLPSELKARIHYADKISFTLPAIKLFFGLATHTPSRETELGTPMAAASAEVADFPVSPASSTPKGQCTRPADKETSPLRKELGPGSPFRALSLEASGECTRASPAPSP